MTNLTVLFGPKWFTDGLKTSAVVSGQRSHHHFIWSQMVYRWFKDLYCCLWTAQPSSSCCQARPAAQASTVQWSAREAVGQIVNGCLVAVSAVLHYCRCTSWRCSWLWPRGCQRTCEGRCVSVCVGMCARTCTSICECMSTCVFMCLCHPFMAQASD